MFLCLRVVSFMKSVYCFKEKMPLENEGKVKVFDTEQKYILTLGQILSIIFDLNNFENSINFNSNFVKPLKNKTSILMKFSSNLKKPFKIPGTNFHTFSHSSMDFQQRFFPSM